MNLVASFTSYGGLAGIRFQEAKRTVSHHSQEGRSPTLFATDRTDRKTYIAQGWIVTDPVALADLGDIPPGEAVIEIPGDVLRFAEEVR